MELGILTSTEAAAEAVKAVAYMFAIEIEKLSVTGIDNCPAVHYSGEELSDEVYAKIQTFISGLSWGWVNSRIQVTNRLLGIDTES